MSHTRSAIIYRLNRLLKYLRVFDAHSKVISVLSVLVNLRITGMRAEGRVITFFRRLAEKMNVLQASLEESLSLSSLYVGFLMIIMLLWVVVFIHVVI